VTNLQCSLSRRRMVLAATRRGRGFPGKTIGVGVDASVAMRNGSPLDVGAVCAIGSSDSPSASADRLSPTADAGWMAASLSRKLVSTRAASATVSVFFAGRFLWTQSAASPSDSRSARSTMSCSQSAADCSGPRLVREGRKLGSLRLEAALTVGARSAEEMAPVKRPRPPLPPCSPRDRSSRSDPARRDRPRPRCRPGRRGRSGARM
jgi:hypothetical protein